MKNILVNNVNAYYGDNHVLKDINLGIKENSVTAFIGPSGCGKSTFLRMLNRMNDYIDGFRKEGEILIDGKEIYEEDVRVEELRQNVGNGLSEAKSIPKKHI